MDGRPPPPPPPHGNSSKSSGLPPGNYDIFIIPPHSSGSGFLYLPSLAPHRNSFLAGVACTLLVVSLWLIIVPAVKQWTATVVQSGGMGVVVLVFGVGVLGWAYGKTQLESAGGTTCGNSAGGGHTKGGFGASSSNPFSGTGTGTGTGAAPKSSWSRPSPGPGAAGWEKAREETRKREQERRQKQEAEKRAREAAEKDKWEKTRAREKEAREKEAREKVAQDRLRREQEAKEKAEKAAREAYEEKVRNPAAAAANSAGKKYQKPTAQSFVGEDEYSYRPYDDPKDSSQSSIFSQSSVHSQSTAPSTAPPKGPPGSRISYRTKDPDKIVIKAVYLFNDALPKPTAQLVAGVGNVTDGLILKMTTEGMFIDDDVRGIGQREWDVKAWTMKLVEVFCPSFTERLTPTPARYSNSPQKKDPVQRFLGNMSPHKADLSEEETNVAIEDLLRTCKSKCVKYKSNLESSQNGDFKGRHVLRASVRDAEGKKYVFIIPTEEAWKVAVGLQRLRRGTQVRALGISGLPASETRMILSSLGWV